MHHTYPSLLQQITILWNLDNFLQVFILSPLWQSKPLLEIELILAPMVFFSKRINEITYEMAKVYT